MSAYQVAIATAVLTLVVLAALDFVRLARRPRELRRDSLTPERLEDLDQFVR